MAALRRSIAGKCEQLLETRRQPMVNQQEPQWLRVLTVNTHKGFNYFNRKFVLPELREAVREVPADIVFLQEVLGAHEALALRHNDQWPPGPQYEFLADTIWPDYAYGRNAVYPNGHHGNALMSKFPIAQFENLDVSIGNIEKRGLLHCRINLPHQDKILHTICVHLGLREGHRQRQLALLCGLVKSIPEEEPIVIAGDFNDWRNKGSSVMRDCGLTDVFVRDLGAPPKTFPAIYPLLRLDRIYVRSVADYRPICLPSQPWARLSDHAPLAVEIQL